MTTKLNLTIDEGTAVFIKSYARKKRTSVSKITQEYYSILKEKEAKPQNKKTSFVDKHEAIFQKYAGKLKGKFDDIDKLKDEYLKEKYAI